MRTLLVIRVLILAIILACIPACGRKAMNKKQAADWYSKYSSMVRWIGYQGSDQQFHYYIARVTDDWAFIQIRKTELIVTDERPYSTASSAPQYHYLVDPKQDYRKIK